MAYPREEPLYKPPVDGEEENLENEKWEVWELQQQLKWLMESHKNHFIDTSGKSRSLLSFNEEESIVIRALLSHIHQTLSKIEWYWETFSLEWQLIRDGVRMDKDFMVFEIGNTRNLAESISAVIQRLPEHESWDRANFLKRGWWEQTLKRIFDEVAAITHALPIERV